MSRQSLAIVLRFGAAMLRSGDTAFRVRDAMGQVAKALGIEHLAVHITIGGMTATAQAGAETVTLAREMAPLGVDASRIAALERLALSSKARPDGRGAGRRDRRHRGNARVAFPAADRALDGGRLGVLFLSQRRRPAGDRCRRRRRWPRPDRAHPAVAQGLQPVRHDRALRRARLGRLLPDRAGLRRPHLRARPCGGLHLVGAVPGAGLPAGRGPARPRAAPDDGRHRPALLCRAADLGGRRRPVHCRGSRRPHPGTAGSGRSRHRADGPAVARHRLLRRRLRLRHPVQQSAAHRAGGRPPDAGRQRDPAGAA